MLGKFLLSALLVILNVLTLQSQEKTWNKLILYSDKNIVFNLLYTYNADLSDWDWLKLEIINTSDTHIQIKDVYYSVDGEIRPQQGQPYLNHGMFGQGNQFDLFHFYYNQPNPSEFADKLILKADSVIYSWIYLTNYASVLIDSRSTQENEVCGFFRINAIYKIHKNEKQIESKENKFCFQWTKSENVLPAKLVHRLNTILLNPTYRWSNTYVTSRLMAMPEIVAGISNNVIIQSILLREDIMNADETILLLTELSKRKLTPNNLLTDYFRNKLENNFPHTSEELMYYWDNDLLETLLNSRLEVRRVANILELNSNYWSNNPNNRNVVFNYFVKQLNFNINEKIDSVIFPEWSKNLKVISISRDTQLVGYLKSLLDNEKEFSVDDWSKYRNYGLIPKGTLPDKIKIRICDVAMIALLRVYDQLEFSVSSRIGTKHYSVKIKEEILNNDEINLINGTYYKNDISLSLYEKELKLTPTLKKRLTSR